MNYIKQIKTSKDIINTIHEFTIEEIEEILIFASDKYYNTDNPVIEDNIYDILIDFLRLKNPKSKILKTIGTTVVHKNKVKLDYWLGSMDKIKPPSPQLQIWMNKYQKPYHLSDKLDGISALLIYRYDKTINMYTRGTSDVGIDISSLIKYIKVPSWEQINQILSKQKISGKSNLIAVRGELIMNKHTFEKKYSELKNPRNTIAGLVNSIKINPERASDTDLIIYEIIDPNITIVNQMKLITNLGFNCVEYTIINKELTFEQLSKYFSNKRTKSDYQLDGIIVTNTEEHKHNNTGNPDYAFAFKDILEDQIAITDIIDIEWNISKDAYIIPTIILKPCIISGIEIKRVTGNNAKHVISNKLGPGAKVKIIRSGDVIPKIIDVIKPGNVKLPPGDWTWSSTKVDIILSSLTNSDVIKKNLYYFFSTLKTKGLGEKIIDKLYTAGLDTIPKIYALTESTLKSLNIDGFKEKTISNLLSSIKKSSTVTLAELMHASNKLRHGFGIERIKLILDNFPDIMNINVSIDDIKNIDSFDTKTASLFVSNLPEFITFYNSIKKYITIKTTKVKKGKLNSIVFVFSSFRDKELQNEIELNGGKVTSSVSKNTNYVIIKDTKSNINTGKVKTAKELGIKIITRDQCLALL